MTTMMTYLRMRCNKYFRPRLQLAHFAPKVLDSLRNLYFNGIKILQMPFGDGFNKLIKPVGIPSIGYHRCLKNFMKNGAIYEGWTCGVGRFHSILEYCTPCAAE